MLILSAQEKSDRHCVPHFTFVLVVPHFGACCFVSCPCLWQFCCRAVVAVVVLHLFLSISLNWLDCVWLVELCWFFSHPPHQSNGICSECALIDFMFTCRRLGVYVSTNWWNKETRGIKHILCVLYEHVWIRMKGSFFFLFRVDSNWVWFDGLWLLCPDAKWMRTRERQRKNKPEANNIARTKIYRHRDIEKGKALECVRVGIILFFTNIYRRVRQTHPMQWEMLLLSCQRNAMWNKYTRLHACKSIHPSFVFINSYISYFCMVCRYVIACAWAHVYAWARSSPSAAWTTTTRSTHCKMINFLYDINWKECAIYLELCVAQSSSDIHSRRTS